MPAFVEISDEPDHGTWPNSISSIEGAETRERTTGATGALNERAAAELRESIVVYCTG